MPEGHQSDESPIKVTASKPSLTYLARPKLPYPNSPRWADAYDNDVEDEEESSPDATGLLELTLVAAIAFEGEAMVKRVVHVLLLATDDAIW